MKTHSFRKGRFSSAQFFFFGQVPLKSNCTTFAPRASAICAVSSVLCESTTKISSAHFTQSRQRGRFAASSRTGTMMETGTVFLSASLIAQTAAFRESRARNTAASRFRNAPELRDEIRAVAGEIPPFHPARFQQLSRAGQDLQFVLFDVDFQNQIALRKRKRIQFLAGHQRGSRLTGLGT